MKVLHIPRSDAKMVNGGDLVFATLLGQALNPLGIEMTSASLDQIQDHEDADAVFLTQIYQIDHAEKAAQWTFRRGLPLLISPLFEEGSRLGYRLTLQGKGRWPRLTRFIGERAAEELFVRREAVRRGRQDVWQRQRKLLQQGILLPNTQYELDHLCHWFKLPTPRATIIPLGIDPERFNLESGGAAEYLPTSIHPWRGKYILQVGLISARKNQLGLLMALRNERVPIVMVGLPSPYEPEYAAEVFSLAHKRGDVVLLDRVDLKTLAALYGQAAAHVLPSWSERPGLVSLEAAACGCNVVTSAAAPVWEYLGRTVGICMPHRPESIRYSVIEAVGRKPSPLLSRKTASMFTWDHTARGFKQVLENMPAA